MIYDTLGVFLFGILSNGICKTSIVFLHKGMGIVFVVLTSFWGD